MFVQKKLVIVGDGNCGKTCLLIAFARNLFNSEYRPTVFENYVADVQIGNQTIELSLWDTSGQEDYDRLRPIQYPETDVILICFSVVWRDSFDNVISRWWPEVKHFCPGVPVLLIGTKSDLRSDKNQLEKLKEIRKTPISNEEMRKMGDRIGAVRFMECSAKTKYNVREVFEEAAKATLAKKRKRKSNCVLI